MIKSSALLALVAVIFSGCAGSSVYEGDVYSSDEAGVVQSVSFGEIIGIRNVTIQKNANGKNTNTTLGTIGGGALGGVLGSGVGGGTGKSVAVVAGSILGAVAGSKTQEMLEQSNALQLTIKKDDGNVISIVQMAEDGHFFSEGQRVQLAGSGSSVKVIPIK